MSQITIRSIPGAIEIEIRKLASKKHMSLSAASILLIQQALGIDPDQEKRRDLSGIFATWSQDDQDEFARNTSQFDEIDDEIWK